MTSTPERNPALVPCFAHRAAPEEAQQMMPWLRVLVVGEIVRDGSTYFYVAGRDWEEATVTDPEEVVVDVRAIAFRIRELWLFDARTGKALKRTAIDDLAGRARSH